MILSDACGQSGDVILFGIPIMCWFYDEEIWRSQ